MSEEVRNKIERFSIATKDLVVRGYNRLADYFEKKRKERKMKNSNAILKMNCMKLMLVLMNICYLAIPTFMIVFGTSALVLNALTVFNVIYIMWMAAGIFLACISIFALIASLKENVVLVNLYGLFLMISFFLQIAVAITAISQIGNAKAFASNLISNMMHPYDYSEYGYDPKLDWIQKSFECCGLDGPEDWSNHRNFETTTQAEYWILSNTTDEQLTIDSLKLKTPVSCCTRESSYENTSCDNYFKDGCSECIREILSSSIMIMGTVALTISVLQILGIVTAFMLARAIRRTKSYRHVLKSDTLSQRVFDTPTHIDYTPLDNSNEN